MHMYDMYMHMHMYMCCLGFKVLLDLAGRGGGRVFKGRDHDWVASRPTGVSVQHTSTTKKFVVSWVCPAEHQFHTFGTTERN